MSSSMTLVTMHVMSEQCVLCSCDKLCCFRVHDCYP